MAKTNEWRELLVTPTSPFARMSAATTTAAEFELILSKIATPHSQYLPTTSARYKALVSHSGAVIEISPESLTVAADFATRIGGRPGAPNPSPSGAALILDYGPTSTIPTNSLRGIQAHKQCSIFASPGRVDISADVDFTGLVDRIELGWKRLVDRGPVGMGRIYKAMAILPHLAGKEMRRPVGFGGDVVT